MWTGANRIATNASSQMRPQEGFVDEAVAEETRFLVSHELHALPSGGTRITYTVRVDGPEAATLGPLVTADFPELLAALNALAERVPVPVPVPVPVAAAA
jgi:hypothetical protein